MHRPERAKRATAVRKGHTGRHQGPVSGGEPTPVSYQKIENMSTADFNDKVFTV